MDIPFIEDTIFFPLWILDSIVYDQLTIYVWVNFWLAYSSPLVCMSVFIMPVSYFFFFFRLYFVRAVLVLSSQQNWNYSTEISHSSLPHPSKASPFLTSPTRVICYHWLIYIDTSQSPKICSLQEFTHCIFYVFGRYYNDMYSSGLFHCLQISLCSTY